MGAASRFARSQAAHGIARVAEHEAIDAATEAAAVARRRALAESLEELDRRVSKPKPKPTPSPSPRPSRRAAAQPRGERVQPSLRVEIDPRIAERKGEDLAGLTVGLSPRRFEEPPSLSIFDMEGKPFITSMSDMSAAGDDILSINDFDLRRPISRRGGQDYMFDNPGSVWANEGVMPIKHMLMAQELRKQHGQDPLFMPWTMAPTGINFSHGPREAMLSYEDARLGNRDREKLAVDIRKIVPEFRSLDDETSIEVFMREASPKKRAALNKLLHERWKRGGLSFGPARLAMTDLDQMGTPGLDLRNVGVIDARGSLSPSTHPSYSVSIPGGGLGRLDSPVAALSLLPDLRAEAGISDPRVIPVGVVPGVPNPRRRMEFNPYGGVIDEPMLRGIEARGYAAGGPVRSSLAVRL